MKQVFQPCPICSSTRITQIFSGIKDYVSKDCFDLQKCNQCGVYFDFPIPRDLNRYYPKRYRRYNKFVFTILQFLYSFRIKKWVKISKEPGSMLEIGCGPGFMLKKLKKLGWTVKGIERTESVAAFAREKFNLDVTHHGIETLPALPTFDLIVLFQVMEHLSDPLGILKESIKRLKKGGKVIINVPNIESWQATFGGSVWAYLDPPRHVFHFSLESLRKLLLMVGLKLVDVSYSSIEHDPYGWIETIITKVTKRYNTITRYLMGLNKFDQKVLLGFIVGGLVTIPAIILSCISSIFKKGGLIQVIAEKEIE